MHLVQILEMTDYAGFQNVSSNECITLPLAVYSFYAYLLPFVLVRLVYHSQSAGVPCMSCPSAMYELKNCSMCNRCHIRNRLAKAACFFGDFQCVWSDFFRNCCKCLQNVRLGYSELTVCQFFVLQLGTFLGYILSRAENLQMHAAQVKKPDVGYLHCESRSVWPVHITGTASGTMPVFLLSWSIICSRILFNIQVVRLQAFTFVQSFINLETEKSGSRCQTLWTESSMVPVWRMSKTLVKSLHWACYYPDCAQASVASPTISTKHVASWQLY